MAPFTHVSPDRKGRFNDGTYGVLYVGERFEVALAETVHHHAIFMAATSEPAGWTSQFREIVMSVDRDLHRVVPGDHPECLDPNDHSAGRAMSRRLKLAGSDGLVYPSVRTSAGECVALFFPDCASNPVQGRHLDYHWDGVKVDMIRDCGSGQIYRLEPDP